MLKRSPSSVYVSAWDFFSCKLSELRLHRNALGLPRMRRTPAGIARTAQVHAGASLVAIGAVTAATRFGVPLPACPFKTLTGLECPGCGAGRSLTAFAHGDFLAIPDHNLLLTILGPLMIVSLLGALANRTPLLTRSGWALPLLISITGFWVLRLLPFESLAYLDSARSR